MLVWKVIAWTLATASLAWQTYLHYFFITHRKCHNCERWADKFGEEMNRKNREWYVLLLIACDLTNKEQHELVSMVIRRLDSEPDLR